MARSISGTRSRNAGGVVFILNVTDPAAARDMLEKLPLGQAHLMSFEPPADIPKIIGSPVGGLLARGS